VKIRRIAIFVVVAVLVTLAACTSPPTTSPAPTESINTIEFTKITAPLSLNEQEPGTHIPYGSVIYHWANGITEVYGPDNTRIFIAKDSEAAMLPHPSGPQGPYESPATFIYQVPSGAGILKGESDNIQKVYLNGALILTIITKSEDYPL
jgi:hypothetical protein